MLAPDWIEEIKVVENNSMLLTDELVKNLIPVMTEFIISKFDNYTSIIEFSSLLFADSMILLKKAQTIGVTKATFDDVAECYKALSFIAREEPTLLWANLRISLGTLFFELQNVEREFRSLKSFKKITILS